MGLVKREGDMNILKVKIAEVKSITDEDGKFGPQKKIVIRETLENGDRWLSGWVPAPQFDSTAWMAGKVLELDVFKSKDGKYWNFKLVSGKARENHTLHEEVMGALRMIFKKIGELEKKIDDLNKSDTYEAPFEEGLEQTFP